MIKEIFKDIPGYEGYYQASNFGRIKSLERNIYSNDKLHYIQKEKILKPCIRGKIKFYHCVDLLKNNKRKNIGIHQLVAMAFLNHIPNGFKIVVDHINNNPLDNRLENLQLITQRENNSKDKKGYSSKYTGVSWDSTRNKWRVSINIKGMPKHLGRFDCEIQASEAYQNALNELINK